MGRFNKKKKPQKPKKKGKTYRRVTKRLKPTSDDEYREFVTDMEKKGTTIVGVDSCMCAECVARRKTGDIRGPVFGATNVAKMQPPVPSPFTAFMEDEDDFIDARDMEDKEDD